MKKRGAGEGTIYKDPDGQWHGQLRLPNGKRRNVYGKNQREIQQKLTQLRREVDAGMHGSLDGEQTFSQFTADWLINHQHQLRSKTKKTYSYLARLHMDEIGDMVLNKVTARVLQKHYARKLTSLSATSVQHLHAFLHVVLENAVRLDILPKNPADYVDAPGFDTEEIQPLSEQQARELVKVIHDDRYEALWMLALSTGMREAELLGLRWIDIDFERSRVRVKMTLHRVEGKYVLEETKSRTSRRTLPIPQYTLMLLQQWKTQQAEEREMMEKAWDETWGLAFTTAAGRPLHYTVALRHFRRQLRNSIIPVTTRLHDLRHTFATLLLERGVNIKVVSELLGHSSITITLAIYGHVTPRMQDAAMVELNALLPPIKGDIVDGFLE